MSSNDKMQEFTKQVLNLALEIKRQQDEDEAINLASSNPVSKVDTLGESKVTGTETIKNPSVSDSWGSETSSFDGGWEENKHILSNSTYSRKDETPVSKVELETFKSEPVDTQSVENYNKIFSSASEFEKVTSAVYHRLSIAHEQKKAAQSKSTDKQATSPIMFSKNTMEDVNGNALGYKRAVTRLNLSKDFLDNISTENRLKNLDMLREKISQGISNFYGSFDRVSSLYVTNGYLVINGVAYTPVIGDENFANNFPMDTYEYIKSGKVAYLFDWGYLLKMINLRVFSIETYDFANDFIANDLNMDNFRVPYFFAKFRKLQKLSIGGEVIDRDNPLEQSSTDSSRSKKDVVEDNIERHSRFSKHFSHMSFDYYKATSSLSSFATDSLVSYAKNRNNKGFLKYSIGVLGRGAFATTAGLINLSAGLVKGLVSLGKEVLHDGFTPYEDNK